MSLNGILDVKIKNDEHLEVYLKYNPNLITPQVIKMEILLFLDIEKFPLYFLLINIQNLKQMIIR